MKDLVRRAKLSYLWITRIAAAPSHYKVPLHRRIQMNLQGGFIADQRVIYDLDVNDKSQYLSEFDWYRSRWINEPFDPMLNNKVTCTEVLKHVTRVPPVLFVKNKGRLWDMAAPGCVSETSVALKAIADEGAVFIKPIGMGKGRGVFRIDCRVTDGEREFSLDLTPVSSERVRKLLDREDGWFMSPAVAQHADLAAIFPGATNTVRIITMRDPGDGTVRLFFAVLRLGTTATVPVDNGSRGGLVAKIDLEDGTLTAARSLWSRDAQVVHPDSGAPIEGAVVPLWQSVKDEVLRLALLFPFLQFVAWDVLVTEDGPCIIEANTSSGVNIIQLWGPQRNGQLGDFYRAHGVIR